MDPYLEKKHQLDFELIKILDIELRNANIDYFMAFGSLIGTMRHQGSIPWDDDIDILVPLKHKKKLLQLLGAYTRINNNYYVQNGRGTDFKFIEPVYFGYNSMLRLDENNFKKIVPIRVESKIDIFFYASLDQKDQMLLEKYGKYYSYLSSAKVVKTDSIIKKTMFKTLNLFSGPFKRKLRQFENKVASNDLNDVLHYWDFFDSKLHTYDFYKKDIYPLKRSKYYDFNVNIPSDHDAILTRLYKDWKTPPQNKESNHGINCYNFDKVEIKEFEDTKLNEIKFIFVSQNTINMVLKNKVKLESQQINLKQYDKNDEMHVFGFLNDSKKIVITAKSDFNQYQDSYTQFGKKIKIKTNKNQIKITIR